MTIKEIETLSGLPRANIRYYESEGLISPKRAENGYREYSQADVNVLLRVKLLRALGLRIDTIKALAAGTLTLDDALDARLEELHTEQENLAAAGRVEAHMARPVVRIWRLYPNLQYNSHLQLLEGRTGRTAARMGGRQRAARCAMESVARGSVGRGGIGAAGCDGACGPQDLPADVHKRSDCAAVCGELRLHSRHGGLSEPGAV